MARNIAEILRTKTHVFFTPESASNFRDANLGNLPVGRITFMNEMSMQFYTQKCNQDVTYSDLPDDREMMRIISEMACASEKEPVK